MSYPYEVKIVTGGKPGATEYDEENVLRHRTLDDALKDAESLRGGSRMLTFDVLGPFGRKVARVHSDGGIDYAPPATHEVVGIDKEDRSERVVFLGTVEEAEDYAERNESPDNSERYRVQPIGEEA